MSEMPGRMPPRLRRDEVAREAEREPRTAAPRQETAGGDRRPLAGPAVGDEQEGDGIGADGDRRAAIARAERQRAVVEREVELRATPEAQADHGLEVGRVAGLTRSGNSGAMLAMIAEASSPRPATVVERPRRGRGRG